MSTYACDRCQDVFDDDYSEHLCENDMFCPKCDERIAQEREEAKAATVDFTKPLVTSDGEPLTYVGPVDVMGDTFHRVRDAMNFEWDCYPDGSLPALAWRVVNV